MIHTNSTECIQQQLAAWLHFHETISINWVSVQTWRQNSTNVFKWGVTILTSDSTSSSNISIASQALSWGKIVQILLSYTQLYKQFRRLIWFTVGWSFNFLKKCALCVLFCVFFPFLLFLFFTNMRKQFTRIKDVNHLRQNILYLNLLVYDRNLFGSSSKVFGNLQKS